MGRRRCRRCRRGRRWWRRMGRVPRTEGPREVGPGLPRDRWRVGWPGVVGPFEAPGPREWVHPRDRWPSGEGRGPLEVGRVLPMDRRQLGGWGVVEIAAAVAAEAVAEVEVPEHYQMDPFPTCGFGFDSDSCPRVELPWEPVRERSACQMDWQVDCFRCFAAEGGDHRQKAPRHRGWREWNSEPMPPAPQKIETKATRTWEAVQAVLVPCRPPSGPSRQRSCYLLPENSHGCHSCYSWEKEPSYSPSCSATA
mmetsp:Transcript_20054/g.41706  ORF Transcript_20054/g.41706 Transcript_20054/m.41706 type:complete len:252 (-) Transcript_20054:485-1240(-)